MKWITPNRSRFTTAATAFATAGYLVFAILSENGGSADAQKRWQEASQNSLSFQMPVDEVSLAEVTQSELGVDPTVTASIRNIADDAVEKPRKPAEEELTVLELIRKNSDVSPGVSAGTGRVSVTVKEGDTLFGLSLHHGIGLEELARLNGLEKPYTIRLGQTIYLAR